MIRIGIVEDDNACATRLVEHLRRYERERGHRFAVVRFTDGAQAVAAHRPGAFDVLLLDVEMPALDGFSAARAIRAVDPDVPIVFVTHLAQQAARGYEVEALGYVVKPVPYFAFAQQVTRALARVRRDHEDALLLAVDGGLEPRAVPQGPLVGPGADVQPARRDGAARVGAGVPGRAAGDRVQLTGRLGLGLG